jgi:hypothetical protein
MATPILQAQGNLAALSTNSNLTVTIPTGEAVNDILVATLVAWVPSTSTGTATIAAPAGWTKFTPAITTITGGLIDAEYAFFWKRATSTNETNPTFTRPANWAISNWSGRIYNIRGCITTGNPWTEFVASTISTAANPSIPALTVQGSDEPDTDLPVAFIVKTDNTTTPTSQDGFGSSLYSAQTEATTATGTDAAMRAYTISFYSGTTTIGEATMLGGSAPAQGGSVYFVASFKGPNERTATGSSFVSQTATGLITVVRTATGSGVGDGSGDDQLVHFKTATGSGQGTQSAVGARIGSTVSRTATGSGFGSSTADTLHNNVRTASGTGAASTGDNATGLHIAPRTATGSGTGASSADWLRTVLVTALGAGAGSSSADRTRTVLVTATGSGSGASSVSGLRTVLVTATGSAIGSSTSQPDVGTSATATGTGTGTSSASGLATKIRSASGSAESTSNASGFTNRTREASGSGAGVSTADTLHNNIRSASGFGGASTGDVASGLHIAPRVATGNGSSSASTTQLILRPRSATGSGSSTGSAEIQIFSLITKTASGFGNGNQTATFARELFKAATGFGEGLSSVERIVTRLRSGTGSGNGTSSATFGIFDHIQIPSFASGKSSVGGSNNNVTAQGNRQIVSVNGPNSVVVSGVSNTVKASEL